MCSLFRACGVRGHEVRGRFVASDDCIIRITTALSQPEQTTTTTSDVDA